MKRAINMQSILTLSKEIHNKIDKYESGKIDECSSKTGILDNYIIHKWRKHWTVEKLPWRDWLTKITKRAQNNNW